MTNSFTFLCCIYMSDEGLTWHLDHHGSQVHILPSFMVCDKSVKLPILQLPLYKGCVDYPTWNAQLVFVLFISEKLQGKLWRPKYTTVIGWCVLLLRWRNAVHRWRRKELLILRSCKRHYLAAFAQSRVFKFGCRAPSLQSFVLATKLRLHYSCSQNQTFPGLWCFTVPEDGSHQWNSAGWAEGTSTSYSLLFPTLLSHHPFLHILLPRWVCWWGCFSMFSNLCQSKSARLPQIL